MPTVQLHLQQKPTTIGLIRYKQPTRTKNAPCLRRDCWEVPKPLGYHKKIFDSLPSLILMINARNIRFTSLFSFCSVTPETKRRTHLLVI